MGFQEHPKNLHINASAASARVQTAGLPQPLAPTHHRVQATRRPRRPARRDNAIGTAWVRFRLMVWICQKARVSATVQVPAYFAPNGTGPDATTLAEFGPQRHQDGEHLDLRKRYVQTDRFRTLRISDRLPTITMFSTSKLGEADLKPEETLDKEN